MAPFAGLMARKLVEDFQNVKAKEPVLILQDLAHLEVEISVPERDMTAGQSEMTPDEITEVTKPVVQVSAIAGRDFPARVKEAATAADPTTRTFQIKLTFERPDDVTILPGMTARVIAQPRGGSGLLVPSQATRADSGGKPYVWVVDTGSMKVSRREVELGRLTGDTVEVVSGLEQGEEIAISGVRELMDGMEVRRYVSRQEASRS